MLDKNKKGKKKLSLGSKIGMCLFIVAMISTNSPNLIKSASAISVNDWELNPEWEGWEEDSTLGNQYTRVAEYSDLGSRDPVLGLRDGSYYGEAKIKNEFPNQPAGAFSTELKIVETSYGNEDCSFIRFYSGTTIAAALIIDNNFRYAPDQGVSDAPIRSINVELETWYHFAAEWNSQATGTNEWTFYINGQIIAQFDSTNPFSGINNITISTYLGDITHNLTLHNLRHMDDSSTINQIWEEDKFFEWTSGGTNQWCHISTNIFEDRNVLKLNDGSWVGEAIATANFDLSEKGSFSTNIRIVDSGYGETDCFLIRFLSGSTVSSYMTMWEDQGVNTIRFCGSDGNSYPTGSTYSTNVWNDDFKAEWDCSGSGKDQWVFSLGGTVIKTFESEKYTSGINQISIRSLYSKPTNYVYFNDIQIDSDDDGLSRKEELLFGTDPTTADSDGDGREDGVEIRYMTNPIINEVFWEDFEEISLPSGYIDNGDTIGEWQVAKDNDDFCDLYVDQSPSYWGESSQVLWLHTTDESLIDIYKNDIASSGDNLVYFRSSISIGQLQYQQFYVDFTYGTSSRLHFLFSSGELFFWDSYYIYGKHLTAYKPVYDAASNVVVYSEDQKIDFEVFIDKDQSTWTLKWNGQAIMKQYDLDFGNTFNRVILGTPSTSSGRVFLDDLVFEHGKITKDDSKTLYNKIVPNIVACLPGFNEEFSEDSIGDTSLVGLEISSIVSRDTEYSFNFPFVSVSYDDEIETGPHHDEVRTIGQEHWYWYYKIYGDIEFYSIDLTEYSYSASFLAFYSFDPYSTQNTVLTNHPYSDLRDDCSYLNQETFDYWVQPSYTSEYSCPQQYTDSGSQTQKGWDYTISKQTTLGLNFELSFATPVQSISLPLGISFAFNVERDLDFWYYLILKDTHTSTKSVTYNMNANVAKGFYTFFISDFKIH
ncbi:hypothetical protein NEF87_002780 [Candidatus Lokiarchaeum ossiferum]|uniref:LamG domain-containing protein n=1 Tax=Candidatus Lokiarchaeum ossiferum TaxID=2951803 RepID=A0ABY6HSL2_9ARCH|nr:hypothetical protein NEF87_002780 [Candidatus Lokiarchaeum sp. B-35]